jgi:hypothetical protein
VITARSGSSRGPCAAATAGRSATRRRPDGRTFRFDNTSGESNIFFDPSVNQIAPRASLDTRPYAFTDWLAYDIETPGDPNIVHDLKLSFVYDRAAGDGPLRAKITRGGDGSDEFIAVITATNASLIHRNKEGERMIGAPLALSADHRPRRVELTNVDYQVTLRIDDVIVAQTTPQDYHPDIPRLLRDFTANTPQPLPSVELSAANQQASLSHVGLWRDVYYINRPNPATSGANLYWGTPIDMPGSIMRLGPDEYFVLGDNSLISGDARYWHQPIDLPADGNPQRPPRPRAQTLHARPRLLRLLARRLPPCRDGPGPGAELRRHALHPLIVSRSKGVPPVLFSHDIAETASTEQPPALASRDSPASSAAPPPTARPSVPPANPRTSIPSASTASSACDTTRPALAWR